MANTNATPAANHLANPRKMNNPLLVGGHEKVIKGTLESAGADSNGHIYVLCPVRKSWSIHSIRLFHDSIANGSDFDLGLYDEDLNVVDINAYADAVNLTTGTALGTEVAFEERGVEKMGQKVYEDAGLSEDDGGWLLLALTGVTVGDGGTISFCVRYTDGS